MIAAEQEIELVNLAFTVDLPVLSWKVARASAGTAAWAGAVELAGGRVKARRPLFFAVQQLMGHLAGYARIRRIALPDDQARVYEITRADGVRWIAWLRPRRLVLPGDRVPEVAVTLDVRGADRVQVESVITDQGRTTAARKSLAVSGGRVRLTLQPTPVFVFVVPEAG